MGGGCGDFEVRSENETAPNTRTAQHSYCRRVISPQVLVLHGIVRVERRRGESEPKYDRPDLPEEPTPVPPYERRACAVDGVCEQAGKARS